MRAKGTAVRTLFELAVATLVLVAGGLAQTSLGTVSGTLNDSSGAVIGSAKIALIHTQNGVRRSAVSNEAGIYRFDAVDLGLYQLKIEHPGFRPFLATAVGVEANRTTTLDIRLEVGSVESQVTVSADAEDMLVKDAPLRGGNFMPREVSDLPLIGLNPLSLARTLQAIPTGVLPMDPAGAIQFSINGQRVRGNNYLLDGTENNDIMFTGVAQPFHIADAVQEVSVQTGNFSVEFGRAGGGVLNVVTKSGTNQVHGTLLWRYQSQRFNSVSNMDKLNGIPKSVFTAMSPASRWADQSAGTRHFSLAAFSRIILIPRQISDWLCLRRGLSPGYGRFTPPTLGSICTWDR